MSILYRRQAPAVSGTLTVGQPQVTASGLVTDPNASTPSTTIIAPAITNTADFSPESTTTISSSLSSSSATQTGSQALHQSSIPLGTVVGACLGALSVLFIIIIFTIWHTRRRAKSFRARSRATSTSKSNPFSSAGPRSLTDQRNRERRKSRRETWSKLDSVHSSEDTKKGETEMSSFKSMSDYGSSPFSASSSAHLSPALSPPPPASPAYKKSTLGPSAPQLPPVPVSPQPLQPFESQNKADLADDPFASSRDPPVIISTPAASKSRLALDDESFMSRRSESLSGHGHHNPFADPGNESVSEHPPPPPPPAIPRASEEGIISEAEKGENRMSSNPFFAAHPSSLQSPPASERWGSVGKERNVAELIAALDFSPPPTSSLNAMGAGSHQSVATIASNYTTYTAIGTPTTPLASSSFPSQPQIPPTPSTPSAAKSGSTLRPARSQHGHFDNASKYYSGAPSVAGYGYAYSPSVHSNEPELHQYDQSSRASSILDPSAHRGRPSFGDGRPSFGSDRSTGTELGYATYRDGEDSHLDMSMDSSPAQTPSTGGFCVGKSAGFPMPPGPSTSSSGR
ncbi:hypothetical protein SISNIDRAFT_486329 [Sistotremastrum niveocremeum HHB9708]|uniref:Uncharacterized protein n=1 Tax=Sistotremastrum niveocremeum HHB9708 TaxID=1314777 RepID=A0A164U1E7_9AGAM|nr:hypothetical protein SISNIDRAFT_486329 [Sistotremastrum niveocremeum HHB9708]